MTTRELKRMLLAADPVAQIRLDHFDFEAMEAELLADAEAGPAPLPESVRPTAPAPGRPSRARRLILAGGAAALAVIAALVLVLAGGGSERSSRAYGAELIRFAESTPLLLLEAPGWRVGNVSESKTREGTDGNMEFLTGSPVSLSRIRPKGFSARSGKAFVSGLPPATARQRLVQLNWAPEGVGIPPAELHGKNYIKLPVLGTIAVVDTRAERYANRGGPDDREMVATWTEDGDVIQLVAAVPDLAGMEERLDWLTKVDSQTWLEAMPAKVVKSADFEGTVREMLKGIPTPKTFAVSRVPDEGLTTSRERVTSGVTSTVACLWLRQWGEAQRDGDEAARLEAEKALAGAKNWPIFRKEGTDKPYTAGEIEEVAQAMPRGYWIYRGHPQNLLAHAESLGCARIGLPLLPEKMKAQRERGIPPPPD
jgi:hypothetical protein